MSSLKKYIFIALFGSLFMTYACNSSGEKKSEDNKEQTQADYLHKEVIRVHDEIMPRMKEISELQTAITNKIDSLEDLEAKPDNLIEELKMRKLGLDACASSMMKWMKNYREPNDEISEADAMKYLKEEKKKIEEIAREFEKQISENKKFTKSL